MSAYGGGWEGGVSTVAATADTPGRIAALPVSPSSYLAFSDPLQAACDAAAGFKGRVELPASFVWNRAGKPAVKLADGVTLAGQGRGSALVLSADVDGIQNVDQVVGNSDIVIENLAIIGSGLGAAGHFQKGVYLKRATNCTIRNCWVYTTNLQGLQIDIGDGCEIAGCHVVNSNGNGISLDDNCIDCEIVDNRVKAAYDCAIGVHNGCTGTIIKGNRCQGTTIGYGIDVFGAPETQVSDNRISGTHNHGIYVHPVSVTYQNDGCIIKGNRITSAGSGGVPTTSDGIQVASIAGVTIRGLIVNANTVQGASGNGVYVGNNVEESGFNDNVIRGCGGDGLRFIHSGVGTPYRCGIAGNYCRGNTGWGLNMSANVQECVIGANYLGGNTAGAATYNAANFVVGDSDATQILVNGNWKHTGANWGVHGSSVAKGGSIATPTAPSAAYVQAEAAAMKTAVDAIRTILQSKGIIA